MQAAERGIDWCAAIDGVTDHRAHEYMRSVCIDRLFYNPDGSMATVLPTEDGLEQIAFVDPSLRQEGEMMAKGWGIDVVDIPGCVAPNGSVGRGTLSRHAGDYTLVRGVRLAQGQTMLMDAAISGEGCIEVRLSHVDGPLLATLTSTSSEIRTVSCTVERSPIDNVQDLYFVFKAPGLLLDWWQTRAS